MRKTTAILFVLGLLVCLAACNGRGSGMPTTSVPDSYASNTSAPQSGESAAAAPASNPQESGENRLIAYFTWAENTVVMDREAVLAGALSHDASVGDTVSPGVDATTSASVFAPGNTAQMAAWIQQEVGGDLHSIVVEDFYPSIYEECLERAADEKAENARPVLSSQVENMDDYDTVFIGYPNWWYSCPMAIFSFIEENDLSGKKIVLFCTHGTGGLAGSVQDITAVLPEDCTIEENVIGVYRNDIPSAQPAIQSWLAEIGY